MSEIWKYTFGRDKLHEKDLDQILELWQKEPRTKITYSSTLKKPFESWAKEKGAILTEDGFCVMKE